MDVLEIPLIVLSEHQLEILLKDRKTETLVDWPDIRFFTLELSAEREVFIYLLEDPSKADDFTTYNLIIPRAPFSLILFERENVELEAALRQYENRYYTPYFLLTAKAVDDSLQSSMPLRADRDEKLVQFDTQNDSGLKEALLKAIKLSLLELDEK